MMEACLMAHGKNFENPVLIRNQIVFALFCMDTQM